MNKRKLIDLFPKIIDFMEWFIATYIFVISIPYALEESISGTVTILLLWLIYNKLRNINLIESDK